MELRIQDEDPITAATAYDPSDTLDISPVQSLSVRIFDRFAVTEERAYYVERGTMEAWNRLSEESNEAVLEFQRRHPIDAAHYEQRMMSIIESGLHRHREGESQIEYLERLLGVARAEEALEVGAANAEREAARRAEDDYARFVARQQRYSTQTNVWHWNEEDFYAPSTSTQAIWDEETLRRTGTMPQEVNPIPKRIAPKKKIPPAEGRKKRKISLKEE